MKKEHVRQDLLVEWHQLIRAENKPVVEHCSPSPTIIGDAIILANHSAFAQITHGHSTTETKEAKCGIERTARRAGCAHRKFNST